MKIMKFQTFITIISLLLVAGGVAAAEAQMGLSEPVPSQNLLPTPAGNNLPTPIPPSGDVWGQGSILNGDLDSIFNQELDGFLSGDDVVDSILGDVLGNGSWGSGDSILGDVLGSGDLAGVLGGDDVVDSILGDVLGNGSWGSGDSILGDVLGADADDVLGDVLGGGGQSPVAITMPTLSQTLSSWNGLASDASGALLSNVVSTFGSEPGMVMGALGVPDVIASQLSVAQTVMGGVENGSPGRTSQRVDRFNVNPVALSETVGKEVSRAASIGFSNTLLSEAGQQAIVAEVQATDETLAEITELASEAQDLDVTQDVMKNLSAMLAQQSSIDVASYGQTIQLRQQFAADALVQAEAAEDLAAMSRRQQTAPMAAAAEVMQGTSMLMLFKSGGDE